MLTHNSSMFFLRYSQSIWTSRYKKRFIVNISRIFLCHNKLMIDKNFRVYISFEMRDTGWAIREGLHESRLNDKIVRQVLFLAFSSLLPSCSLLLSFLISSCSPLFSFLISSLPLLLSPQSSFPVSLLLKFSFVWPTISCAIQLLRLWWIMMKWVFIWRRRRIWWAWWRRRRRRWARWTTVLFQCGVSRLQTAENLIAMHKGNVDATMVEIIAVPDID